MRWRRVRGTTKPQAGEPSRKARLPAAHRHPPRTSSPRNQPPPHAAPERSRTRRGSGLSQTPPGDQSPLPAPPSRSRTRREGTQRAPSPHTSYSVKRLLPQQVIPKPPQTARGSTVVLSHRAPAQARHGSKAPSSCKTKPENAPCNVAWDEKEQATKSGCRDGAQTMMMMVC